MIRLRKVKAVASFEFFTEVKRPGFIISIFSVPLVLLVYAGIVTLVGVVTKKSVEETQTYGVVDYAGVVAMATPDTVEERGTFVFLPMPDSMSAIKAMQKREISGFVSLGGSYWDSGHVAVYWADWAGIRSNRALRATRELVLRHLLVGRIADSLGERIRDPMPVVSTWTVQGNGDIIERSDRTWIARLGVPLGFAVLLFFAILGTSMALVQGTAAEKENRVIDILLSSAHADEILAGKLIGVGGSSLLQVAAWFGMGGLAGLYFAGPLAAAGVDIGWGTISVGLVYFVLGYLFLGSLTIGTGSIGTNMKEAQQWSLIWTGLTILPMIFLVTLIGNPHSTLAKVFTWSPFSAPIMVVFRLSMDPEGIGTLEVIGPLVVLLVGIWIALQIGARLYRVGLLVSGGRVRLAELWRQSRITA